MPPVVPEQLPILAAALIRLRGDTLSRVDDATGIRAANLSVWLRGREQVISARRIVSLLHYLGIEGGRLRTDVLHQWRDNGALLDSKTVLAAFADDAQPVWVFRDDRVGLVKVRYLRAADVYLRLEVQPGVGQSLDLTDIVHADRVIDAAVPMATLPTVVLAETQEALFALAENAGVAAGEERNAGELLLNLARRRSDVIDSLGGWAQLERALGLVLDAGVRPGEIAEVVESHYRMGGNPAHAGKGDSV